MPSMRGAGDESFTLGIIFASGGVGCLLGPLVANPFTPDQCADTETLTLLPVSSTPACGSSGLKHL